MFSNFLNKTNAALTILPVVTVGTSTVKGVAIDRTGYLSAAVMYNAGVCPSIPTGFTVALTVEDSVDTTDGNFATFATFPTFGTAADLSAASVQKYFDVNLRGAKKYIRVKEVLTFTGGSSPSQVGSVSFVLGDKNIEPAGSATVLGS